MKIVHVEDGFFPSAGYQLNFLAKWNVRHGHEVVLVVGNSYAPWASVGFLGGSFERMDREYESQYGVKIIRVHSKARISGREVLERRLFQIVDDEKPDIVLVHGSDTLTALRFIRKINLLSYPVIFDNHMLEIASRNRFRSLFRFLVKHLFTRKLVKNRVPIVALSNSTKEFVVKNYGMPRELVPVISLGTDTSIFFPDYTEKMETRKEMGIPDESIAFIYTGKISPDKKVHLLAEAFQKEFQRSACLLVIGSGKGEYAEKFFRKLALSENKVLTFETQRMMDLPRFYRAADFAVWPGASSLSFYDAQACGLPVILENVDINRERLSSDNGFLFEPDSASYLRRVLESATNMNDKDIRFMGEKGQRITYDNFSYDVIAQKFEQFMIQTIKRFERFDF